MTVLDFLRLTRANLGLIFVCMSLGLIVMFLYTVQQPTLYSATSTGFVKAPPATSAGEQLTNNSLEASMATQYAKFMTSSSVAQRVIDDLGLDAGPAAVASSYSAAADGGEISITASADTPEAARELANAAVRALAAQVAEYQNIGKAEGATDSTLLQIYPNDQAALPDRPSSPRYSRNLLIGAGLGTALGYAIGLLRRSVDRRARSVTDFEESTKASVIGIIPEAEPLGKANRGVYSDLGPAAEAFRSLRTNLRFVDVDRPPRSIVITSSNASEGKSTVAANLARVIAATGQPVVLIDADLRRPTLAKSYDIDPAIGLTQVLAGDITIEEALQPSSHANLQLVSAGRTPPNPSELLGSQRMHAIVEHLSEDYLVILDAPPLLPVTDAGLLTTVCDGALLVGVAGRTYREQLELARRVLDQVGGRVFGAVINRAPLRGLGTVVYGYGYGYGYKTDYESRQAYERKRGTRRRAKPAAETDAPVRTGGS